LKRYGYTPSNNGESTKRTINTDELVAAFDQLADHPKLGSACDDIRKGYRRSRMGKHAIYFCITDYGIAIIRILHDRMDAPRHL
jgi:toxin ParE1/3/4